MMISRVTGCTTKSAEEIAPNHTIGFNAFSGKSFTVATAPDTTNAGTQSHAWKAKLPK